MKIFAAVGTQKFPFDRLIDALDEMTIELRCSTFVQFGSSKSPGVCQGCSFLTQDEYQKMIESADVVVVHGGVGTIRTALAGRAKVIAVPRLALYGEHVDDHQKEIVSAFADAGHIIPCLDLAYLVNAVQSAIIRDLRPFDPTPCTTEEEISKIMVASGFNSFFDDEGKGGVAHEGSARQ